MSLSTHWFIPSEEGHIQSPPPLTRFADELAQWGPAALAGQSAPTLAAAQSYCRRLATSHYENFIVVSRLVPQRFRQAFCDIYAYCRWADDLADEVHHPGQSLALLDWWQTGLDACFGHATRSPAEPSLHTTRNHLPHLAAPLQHPVFVALTDTIARFQLPREPFADLLVAFRQDQSRTRYASVAQVLDYCRHSANPVGRLVLALDGIHDPQRVAWSDAICTGLQWANFCQDVAGDWRRGRIYLPAETLDRHAAHEAQLAAGHLTPAWRAVLEEETARAEFYLRSGLPLLPALPPDLRLPVHLFIHGGLAILTAIRAQGYDVWTHRPQVGKITRLRLLTGAWLASLRR